MEGEVKADRQQQGVPPARGPATHAALLLDALGQRLAVVGLEQLVQEAVVTVPRALIAETIDLIAVLSGRGADRRLSELARVTGLTASGDYALTPLFPPTQGSHP